jgi:5-formyltetrahydrofolate cyclo-ligase
MIASVQREHDQDQMKAWSKSAKAALRRRMRALRQALPPAAAAARSQRIVEHLMHHPMVASARAVALFWPMSEKHEIDLRFLDATLRKRGVHLYYPFMSRTDDGGFATGFRLTERVEDLAVRENRFAEPPPSAIRAERGDIDVVVVPALAATPDGHRLGYGAGFYDATLADVCPPAFSIAVVHDFQLLLELPREEHDRATDAVVTDRPLP